MGMIQQIWEYSDWTGVVVSYRWQFPVFLFFCFSVFADNAAQRRIVLRWLPLLTLRSLV